MASRSGRGRKFTPLLSLAVAAVACGHVQDGDFSHQPPKTDAVAGTSSGTGVSTTTGGAGVSMSTGGAGGVAPPSTGGTYGGVAGYGTAASTGGFCCSDPIRILPCPATPPAEGSSCGTGALFSVYPPVCSYRSESCPTAQAVCNQANYSWKVTSCAITGEGGAGGGPGEAGGAAGFGGAD